MRPPRPTRSAPPPAAEPTLTPATLVQAAYVGGHFAVECLGEPMELMWADMRPSLRAMMPRQAQASALALSFPLKAAGIPNSEALTLILLGALVRVPSRGPVAHAAPTSHRPSPHPLPPQITCIGGCSFYSLALAVQRLCRARRRDREGGVSRGRSSESRSRGRHRSRRRVEQKDNRRVTHERSPAASREYSTSSTSRGSGRYYRDGGRHGGGYPRSGGRVAYHRDGGKVLSDESCSGSEGWV